MLWRSICNWAILWFESLKPYAMFLCLIAERYSLIDLKLRLSVRPVTNNINTFWVRGHGCRLCLWQKWDDQLDKHDVMQERGRHVVRLSFWQ